jgi:hypothetical protein
MSKQKPNNPIFWALQGIHEDVNGNTLKALQKNYDISNEKWEKIQESAKQYISTVNDILQMGEA